MKLSFSNPFRLLMGDVRYSPFATVFLDAFAPEVGQHIGKRERLTQDLLVSLWNQDRPAARQKFNQLARLPHGGSHDVVAHFTAASLADSETSAYALQVDSVFPYNLYGGQQDGSSVMIPSRDLGGDTFGGMCRCWKAVGGWCSCASNGRRWPRPCRWPGRRCGTAGRPERSAS